MGGFFLYLYNSNFKLSDEKNLLIKHEPIFNGSCSSTNKSRIDSW
jgi:hypothetical protein